MHTSQKYHPVSDRITSSQYDPAADEYAASEYDPAADEYAASEHDPAACAHDLCEHNPAADQQEKPQLYDQAAAQITGDASELLRSIFHKENSPQGR